MTIAGKTSARALTLGAMSLGYGVIGRSADFLAGARATLLVAALVLIAAGAIIVAGTRNRRRRASEHAPMGFRSPAE
jgi:hypothetical protein